MDPTALSVAARELRTYLAAKLGLEVTQLAIGHPAAAAREQENNSSNAKDLLNLFFYRVEYDGYPPDGSNQDPFYVRAFCLLTAFCVRDAQNNGLSAGEKDLRLIGGVMHWLYAKPYVQVRDEQETEVALLQMVPSQLTLDDLNHLWATQGELPYRLSVAYELALMPVPIGTAVDRQPRVGSLGLQVGPVQSADSRIMSGFRLPLVRVATADPAWAPAIRFVDGADRHAYSLAFSVDDMPDNVAVVGAGVPGTSVDLVWDAWDSASGWQRLGDTQPLPLHTNILDPDAPAAVTTTKVEIPRKTRGQLQLTAQRAWRRPDGVTVSLASNPLLISIYEGGET